METLSLSVSILLACWCVLQDEGILHEGATVSTLPGSLTGGVVGWRGGGTERRVDHQTSFSRKLKEERKEGSIEALARVFPSSGRAADVKIRAQ